MTINPNWTIDLNTIEPVITSAVVPTMSEYWLTVPVFLMLISGLVLWLRLEDYKKKYKEISFTFLTYLAWFIVFLSLSLLLILDRYLYILLF